MMVHFLSLWLLNALAFVITAYLVPGFRLSGFLPAMVGAALLGLVNAAVRPLLILLTLPITLLTLGLFLLVVNALCLLLVSFFTPGFKILGFGWAILGAIVLSLVSWGLHQLVVAL